jgi:hypothetical protein
VKGPKQMAQIRNFHRRLLILARLRHAAMSAVRSLSGGNRTWCGQPNSVANDPTQTFNQAFSVFGKRSANVLAMLSVSQPSVLKARPLGPDLKSTVAQFASEGDILGIRGRIAAPSLGGHRMWFSSTLAIASSSIALLMCSLGGTAISQAATPSDTATRLPTTIVEAPKQVARPHTPRHRAIARSTVSRQTSATTQTSSATPLSVSAKLAKLEKVAGSCVDGCVTSFRYGNAPWHGCSASGGTFSPTCRNVYNFKTYAECKETGLLLGWRDNDGYWYCSSLALK